MKPRHRSRILLLVGVSIQFSLATFLSNSLLANPLYWNPGGVGGDGNWGTSPGDKNWNTVPGAPAGNTFWPDSIDDSAVFQDAIGGTVTVFDPVQAHGIVQNGADYTINAGTITLVRDSALASPFIEVQAGHLSVDSILSGNSGMIKNGAGVLTLSGDNTYTGITRVSAGSLALTGSLTSESLEIEDGAGLLIVSGGLTNSAQISSSGTLTINSDETVTTYIQNGNGVLNGSATLTTTGGATLNGGTVSGSLLGNITSTGDVLVSGSITGGNLSLTGGTLTLSGTSTHSLVDISAPATLLVTNGGLDSAAAITNSGNLTINSDEIVTTYIQNGSGVLNGSATLTATGGATLNGGTVSGSLLGNITSTGDVLVSGSITGGNLSLTGGTLTLSGTSTHSLVDISAPATLLVTNGGLDSAAAITNSGNLTINSDETVTTYIQNGNGVLNGSATLTATGGATLNGGTVSGLLLGNITSTGDVLVSGSVGGDTLSVTGGMLELSGVSNHLSLSIASGASLLDTAGGLNSAAAISNSGTLTVNADDTVSTYQQNAGALLDGTADLIVRGGAFLHGGTVSGSLVGNILTDGSVRITGKTSGGSLSILAGELELGGVSDSLYVAVSSGASLLNTHGGLHKFSYLNNSGKVTLGTDDYIRLYVSNGGSLAAGTGTLSAANVLLNEGTMLEGDLTASRLSSNGTVTNRGILMVQSLEIASGTFINTGTLGDESSRMTLFAGATLVASGRERFSTLTTFHDGVGTWRGDLKNSSAVAPGDNGGFGTLRVEGNFRQTPTGLLQIDLSDSGNDLVAVTGDAKFNGTLILQQTGTDLLRPFAPVQVVDAASYSGNFSSLIEDLDGAVWFNPGNGSIMLMSSGGDMKSQFPHFTGNQVSTWSALYDDVVDPGFTNITQGSADGPGLWIGSGIADSTNPDLMWALEASFTPNGLDADLLNRLSPEVYASFNDYAVQATRSHLRSALDAPTLPALSLGEDAKSASAPPRPAGDWEFFAAADYFDASTEHSPNQADYSLTSSGILTGAKTRLDKHTLIAGYVAFDAGTVDGEWIDADQTGWSLGVFSRSVLHERSQTVLTAALAHGRYEFDGSRESAIADAGGWRPGDVDFSNVSSFSTELFLGIESRIQAHERVRLIPSAGFRAAFATMDGFTESTGSAAGSPIALTVGRDHQEHMIAECGLTAETDINDRLVGWAHLGFSAGIGEDSHVLQASFANGSRPMRASTDGLSDDLIRLGLGAEYRMSDSVRIHFGYQAELNSGASTMQGFNVSTSFRF